MTTLACPKCRQAMPEAALDAGQCPACGFPLDGPLALDSGSARRRAPVLAVAAAAALGAAAGAAGHAYYVSTQQPEAPREVARIEPAPPAVAVRHVAPLPHAPKARAEQPAPPAVAPPSTVEAPKKGVARPVGVVMKVDPEIAPNRHFDHPDDTATLPDLNSGDRVTLTGKVRVLRLGSVNGNAVVDASGLVAEEIVIGGDLNGEAVVKLNAPGGKVTIGGYVVGSAKLTVAAPGGEVLVTAESGRFAGGSTTKLTTKRFDVAGKLGGGAKLFVTLTAGGSLKLRTADEGAILTYKKSAATDPALMVERGTLHGGAKVIAE